jgi:hypothetical protein
LTTAARPRTRFDFRRLDEDEPVPPAPPGFRTVAAGLTAHLAAQGTTLILCGHDGTSTPRGAPIAVCLTCRALAR